MNLAQKLKIVEKNRHLVRNPSKREQIILDQMNWCQNTTNQSEQKSLNKNFEDKKCIKL